MPVYGSGVRLIVGGTNGSNVGTDAEEGVALANPQPSPNPSPSPNPNQDGFALKPDFSERAAWLYLTVRVRVRVGVRVRVRCRPGCIPHGE